MDIAPGVVNHFALVGPVNPFVGDPCNGGMNGKWNMNGEGGREGRVKNEKYSEAQPLSVFVRP